MSTFRTYDDTHGPLLDPKADPGSHAADEEHLELTDARRSDGEELIGTDGRNATQRALDAQSDAERGTPVVPENQEEPMDRDRIEGKRKELEGELQQKVGEAKDKLREFRDGVDDRLAHRRVERDRQRELKEKNRNPL